MMLNWSLNKEGGTVWTGFIWFWIGTRNIFLLKQATGDENIHAQ